MPNVTYCPPAAAHGIESFDICQFASRSKAPVSAEYGRQENGDLGFTGTGIAFDNYLTMHTHRHKQAGGRRLDTPTWAQRPAQVAEVIAYAMLKRANHRTMQQGLTARQKMELAYKSNNRSRASLVSRLDKLCREYVDLKSTLPPSKTKTEIVRDLEIAIEGIDTQLVIMDKQAAILAGCIYHYWQRGVDSPAVAEALHIKPPHVRIMLWRLRQAAAELGYDNHIKVTPESVARIKTGMAVGRPRKPLPPRPRLYPCDDAVAVQMYKDGSRICEITEAMFGARLGRYQGYIRSLLRRAGVLRAARKE